MWQALNRHQGRVYCAACVAVVFGFYYRPQEWRRRGGGSGNVTLEGGLLRELDRLRPRLTYEGPQPTSLREHQID